MELGALAMGLSALAADLIAALEHAAAERLCVVTPKDGERASHAKIEATMTSSSFRPRVLLMSCYARSPLGRFDELPSKQMLAAYQLHFLGIV